MASVAGPSRTFMREGPCDSVGNLFAGGLLRYVASLTLLGAGVIHFAAMDTHRREWWIAGLFFAAVAVLQIGLGFVLLLTRSPVVAIAAVGVSTSVIAVWVTSRTLGIPFGPHPGVREMAARSDIIATGFALTTAVALSLLLAGRGRVKHPLGSPSPHHLIAAVALAVGVVPLTVLALAPAAGCTRADEAHTVVTGSKSPLELLENHHAVDPYRLDFSDGAGAEDRKGGTTSAARCHDH